MENYEQRFYEKDWFVPVVASLLFHLGLLILAVFIHFADVSKDPQKNNLEFRLNKVQTGPSPSGKPGGGARLPDGQGSGYPGSGKAEDRKSVV